MTGNQITKMEKDLERANIILDSFSQYSNSNNSDIKFLKRLITNYHKTIQTLSNQRDYFRNMY